MDDIVVGRLFRAIRIHRGWRQLDVATRCDLSRSQVSRLERGLVDELRLCDLRRIGTSLEVRVRIVPTWRGGDADRIVNEGHVRLQGAILALLPRDWQAVAEVPLPSPDRGVVDIVAWHPGRRAMLLVEVKTELADPAALLAQVGRYRRAMARLAREQGWSNVATLGVWVAVADSTMNRSRVARAGAILRGAFPVGGRDVHRWLIDPRSELAALSFIRIAPRGSTTRQPNPVRRVRCRRPARLAAGRAPTAPGERIADERGG